MRIIAILLVFASSTVLAQGNMPPLISEATVAPALALGNAFAAVSDQSKGFVVSVLSEKFMTSRNDQVPTPFDEPFLRRFFGIPFERGPSHRVPVSGLGSGFLIDEQGHVLTSNHVVEGVEKIHVVLQNKQSYEATVLGGDSKTDIAVLQLKGSFPKNLTVSRLGDSDTLKAGHLVLAFGAPFGLTQTVTFGIISGTGRSDVGIADIEDFVQTDAPINPGNSGGPLVNMRGEVIGINTAIATSVGQSAGVGFAVPINMAKEILPTLLQGKKVVRGMLGVGVQDVTPSLEKQFHLLEAKGALISQVNSGSPAEKAGIKPGDVIIKFAGKAIEDSRQLKENVARKSPGVQEEVTLIRNGKELTVAVKLGELPSGAPQATSNGAGEPLEKFGIEAQTLTPEIKSRLNFKENNGILITNIDEASPAAVAGLMPGDVITEIDRKKVDNVGQANEILAKAKNSHEALLLVNHNGESIYVTLEIG